ncbi:MAG: tetratricopeptide repeat protein [bacterium]
MNTQKSIYKKILFIIAVFLLFSVQTVKATASERTLVSLNAEAYGLYLKGNYDSALSLYKKAISIYINSAPLYDGMADVYLKKGLYSQAYSNYNTAIKLDPKNSLYKIHAQKALYQSYLNMIENAKLLMAKAISLCPSNLTIISNFENFQNNNLKKLDLISDFYQNSEDINLSQGNLARFNKNYPEAIKFYIKSIESKKANYEAYNNLGLLYMDKNKNNNAVYYLNKALELNSTAAYSYNNLGIAYQKLKNFNEANKYFDLAIEAGKTYSSGYNNKAVCLIGTVFENFDGSIKYLESITKKEPQNVAAKQILGLFQALKGDYNSAINIYKSAIELSKDNCFLLKKLGDFLFINNQYSESIDYYKKAISINAKDSEIYTAIARAYEKNEDSKNAFTNYQTAIRIDANNANTYKYFGYFLINQKRKPEAKGMLKKYLELAPNSYDYLTVQNLANSL